MIPWARCLCCPPSLLAASGGLNAAQLAYHSLPKDDQQAFLLGLAAVAAIAAPLGARAAEAAASKSRSARGRSGEPGGRAAEEADTAAAGQPGSGRVKQARNEQRAARSRATQAALPSVAEESGDEGGPGAGSATHQAGAPGSAVPPAAASGAGSALQQAGAVPPAAAAGVEAASGAGGSRSSSKEDEPPHVAGAAAGSAAPSAGQPMVATLPQLQPARRMAEALGLDPYMEPLRNPVRLLQPVQKGHQVAPGSAAAAGWLHALCQGIPAEQRQPMASRDMSPVHAQAIADVLQRVADIPGALHAMHEAVALLLGVSSADAHHSFVHHLHHAQAYAVAALAHVVSGSAPGAELAVLLRAVCASSMEATADAKEAELGAAATAAAAAAATRTAPCAQGSGPGSDPESDGSEGEESEEDDAGGTEA